MLDELLNTGVAGLTTPPWARGEGGRTGDPTETANWHSWVSGVTVRLHSWTHNDPVNSTNSRPGLGGVCLTYSPPCVSYKCSLLLAAPSMSVERNVRDHFLSVCSLNGPYILCGSPRTGLTTLTHRLPVTPPHRAVGAKASGCGRSSLCSSLDICWTTTSPPLRFGF